MQSMRRRIRWRVLSRSALRPLHLGLLALSLPLFAELPRLGTLGVLIYALLVWRDAADPRFARRVLDNQEGDVPEPQAVAGPYRECVTSAEEARARIHAAIDDADRPLGRVIAPIKTQAEQVLQRLYGLVERAQRLDEFLCRYNREEIEASVAALEQEAAACADEFSRDQYLQARNAREEQLRDYDELCLCLERVRAQMTNVRSSLEAAEAKVMKLQAADLRHAGTVSDAVTRSLQALSQEMVGFQESIDATMALRAR